MKPKTVLLDVSACPMNYPGFVFRALSKQGYGAEVLLKGTGLTQECFLDPNFRVEFAALRRFILNAIDATGDPHLGPRLALSFEAAYIGPPAYAAMNAAHLADGLEVFGRFVDMTFPAIEFAFPARSDDLGSRDAEVRLRPRIPLEDIAYFVTGSALVVLHSLLKDMLRLPLVASRLEVTISEPKGWAEVAVEFTRVSVHFEARENRLVFPADLLDQPLPGADPINHQRLVAVCEQFSGGTDHRATPVRQLVSFLESEKNLGKPLSSAACALGYSERGLRRKLERSGTSYRKLMEQILESRARQMLAKTSLPISIIADELGYETPSNFARSFKRWTGKTPKAYRDEGKTAGDAGQK